MTVFLFTVEPQIVLLEHWSVNILQSDLIELLIFCIKKKDENVNLEMKRMLHHNIIVIAHVTQILYFANREILTTVERKTVKLDKLL